MITVTFNYCACVMLYIITINETSVLAFSFADYFDIFKSFELTEDKFHKNNFNTKNG